MLILTRRISEKLIIQDDIKLTVLGVKGRQVRLGIHAPKEISIYREELYQTLQQEKQISDPLTTEDKKLASARFE